jgi:hypothetical protein
MCALGLIAQFSWSAIAFREEGILIRKNSCNVLTPNALVDKHGGLHNDHKATLFS